MVFTVLDVLQKVSFLCVFVLNAQADSVHIDRPHAPRLCADSSLSPRTCKGNSYHYRKALAHACKSFVMSLLFQTFFFPFLTKKKSVHRSNK